MVFENTVMTIQQVVESQSAKQVGNLAGVFKDGKCPTSLKASTGLKRMYAPADADIKAMLTKACMSEYLELLFIVAIRDGIVVPKGLAIVVLKQLVVKKEAIQTMIPFWVPRTRNAFNHQKQHCVSNHQIVSKCMFPQEV